MNVDLNASVGDRLILRNVSSRFPTADREVIVVKVGRKWGYAQPEGGASRWNETKFDLSTGYEDGKGYTPNYRVLTPEMDEAEKRRKEAVIALEKHGFVKGGYGPFAQSTDTLEAIVRLLDEAGDE